MSLLVRGMTTWAFVRRRYAFTEGGRALPGADAYAGDTTNAMSATLGKRTRRHPPWGSNPRPQG